MHPRRETSEVPDCLCVPCESRPTVSQQDTPYAQMAPQREGSAERGRIQVQQPSRAAPAPGRALSPAVGASAGNGRRQARSLDRDSCPNCSADDHHRHRVCRSVAIRRRRGQRMARQVWQAWCADPVPQNNIGHKPGRAALPRVGSKGSAAFPAQRRFGAGTKAPAVGGAFAPCEQQRVRAGDRDAVWPAALMAPRRAPAFGLHIGSPTGSCR